MLPTDIAKIVSPRIAAFLEYSASKAGVCEDPPGSNRSFDIDAWAREFGSQEAEETASISASLLSPEALLSSRATDMSSRA